MGNVSVSYLIERSQDRHGSIFFFFVTNHSSTCFCRPFINSVGIENENSKLCLLILELCEEICPFIWHTVSGIMDKQFSPGHLDWIQYTTGNPSKMPKIVGITCER